MTQPSEPNDFVQPTPPANASSSNVWVWVAASLGCGCLGLFIIAIISAIALPSFLNQANKARQAEAKAYVSAINRGQQAYRIEKPTFSNSLEQLGLGIKPETKNYNYYIIPQPDNSSSVIVTAHPKNPGLKSYTGAVFAIGKGNDVTTVTVVCESLISTTVPPAIPAPPKDEKSPIECPPGSQALRR